MMQYLKSWMPTQKGYWDMTSYEKKKTITDKMKMVYFAILYFGLVSSLVVCGYWYAARYFAKDFRDVSDIGDKIMYICFAVSSLYVPLLKIFVNSKILLVVGSIVYPIATFLHTLRLPWLFYIAKGAVGLVGSVFCITAYAHIAFLLDQYDRLTGLRQHVIDQDIEISQTIQSLELRDSSIPLDAAINRNSAESGVQLESLVDRIYDGSLADMQKNRWNKRTGQFYALYFVAASVVALLNEAVEWVFITVLRFSSERVAYIMIAESALGFVGVCMVFLYFVNAIPMVDMELPLELRGSIKNRLRRIFSVFANPALMSVVGLCAYAAYNEYLLDQFFSEIRERHMRVILFIYPVACVILAYPVGLVYDKLGWKPVFLGMLVSCIAAHASVYFSNAVNLANMVELKYVCSFLLAIQRTIVSVFQMAIIVTMFWDQCTTLFSLNLFVAAFVRAVLCFVAAQMTREILFLIVSVGLITATLQFLFTNLFQLTISCSIKD